TIVLRRQTRQPIIYRQILVGEVGRPFTIYKFRTMRPDAEEPGEAAYAQEDDPRVTSVGRFLRKTHLDELPQLWVVLKGDMSVVGPRPERPEFIPMLEEAVPFFTRRLLVKPGITGWAQLRRDYASDLEGAADKLSYDLWYVRHRNVIVDLAICAKTLSTLLLRPGRWLGPYTGPEPCCGPRPSPTEPASRLSAAPGTTSSGRWPAQVRT